MRLSTEAWLVLLIVALYLQDCLVLLRADEAVLTAAGRRWLAGFGARGWTLAGRQPLLANPLLPQRSFFLLRWHMGQNAEAPRSSSAVDLAFTEQPQRLRVLTPFVWLAWLDLLVALPLALYFGWGGLAILAVLGLAYLNLLVAIALILWRREALGLGQARLAPVLVEMAVCVPYSINLVRRLSRLQLPQTDFLAAAQRLLKAEDFTEVRRQCLRRVDDRIEACAEGSAEMAALQSQRAQFQQAVRLQDEEALS